MLKNLMLFFFSLVTVAMLLNLWETGELRMLIRPLFYPPRHSWFYYAADGKERWWRISIFSLGAGVYLYWFGMFSKEGLQRLLKMLRKIWRTLKKPILFFFASFAVVMLVNLWASGELMRRIQSILYPPRDLWIDYAADGFDGGTGTKDDPYRIATAKQLAYLAKSVALGEQYENAYFEVTADIDLAGRDWVPIGDVPYLPQFKGGYTYFAGHFNGNEKKISNLEIKQPRTHLRGLFGIIEKADLRNIVLTNVSIAPENDEGLLRSGGTGAVAGMALTFSSITDCSVTGEIDGLMEVGGVIGLARDFTLARCAMRGKVAGNINVGGLIGFACDSLVENNWVSADIIYRGVVPSDGAWSEKSPNAIFSSSYRGVLDGSKGGGGGGGGGFGKIGASLIVQNIFVTALSADLEEEKKYLAVHGGHPSFAGNLAGVVFNYTSLDQTSFDQNIVSENTNMRLVGGYRSSVSQDVFVSMQSDMSFKWSESFSEDLQSVPLVAGQYNVVTFDLGQEGFSVVPRTFLGMELDVEGKFLKISGTAHALIGDYPVALVNRTNVKFLWLRIISEESANTGGTPPDSLFRHAPKQEADQSQEDSRDDQDAFDRDPVGQRTE
ncbi:MAG: hypothetical protein LBP21_05565 [Synergistaceae bacterium]|nr:hypothetical protein [Synergistaceae bacterium]